MTHRHLTTIRRSTCLSLITVLLAACGGGGSGGGGGNGNPPPPPPQAVTYTLEVTDVSLTDLQTGRTVDGTGLPVSGATASRNQ